MIWSHLTKLLLPGLAAHRKTLAEVTEQRDALKADLVKRIGAEFELFSVPGDPYWQPRDPVLAIAATRFEANPRHKTANLCKRVMVPDGDLTSPAKLFARFENTFPAQTWQCPSHPVEIEWEVATSLLNLDESDQSAPTSLPPHALVSHFAPPSEPHKSAEAAIRSENVALSNCRALSVRGRSLCLPGTMHAFRYRIASWIVRHADVASLPTTPAFHDVLGGFTQEQITGSEVLAAVQFQITERGDLQSALVEWVAAQGWTLLPKQPARAFSSPPLPSAAADDTRLAQNFARALAQLAAISPDDADEEALNIQTISLDGLNDACGGFDRRYQLPVADPLIASDRLARVVEIAAEIDRFGGMEPCHSFGYAPLRTGYLTPGRLTMIDSFGIRAELAFSSNDTQKAIASSIAPPAGATLPPLTAFLPPRFVQPARLDFRWLAAGTLATPMSDHPAAAPVCGWLSPNWRDTTLHVFDDSGQPLGAIATGPAGPHWIQLPHAGKPIFPHDVENRRLRLVVAWILERCDGDDHNARFNLFFQSLAHAEASIHPAGVEDHDVLHYLLSRPIAVVGAAVSVALRGLTQADPGIAALGHHLRRVRAGADHMLRVLPAVQNLLRDHAASFEDETMEAADEATRLELRRMLERIRATLLDHVNDLAAALGAHAGLQDIDRKLERVHGFGEDAKAYTDWLAAPSAYRNWIASYYPALFDNPAGATDEDFLQAEAQIFYGDRQDRELRVSLLGQRLQIADRAALAKSVRSNANSLINRHISASQAKEAETRAAFFATSASPNTLHAFRAAIEDYIAGLNALLNPIFSGYDRPDADIGSVHVPVQIGDHRRANDGLYGYWVEGVDENAPFASAYRAMHDEASSAHGIETAEDGHATLSVNATTPVLLTMLMDLRGAVHLSSGVLPPDDFELPGSAHAEALKDIEPFFFCGPAVQDQAALRMPLPDLAGYQWRFIARQPDGAFAPPEAILPMVDEAAFDNGRQLREGWLWLRRAPEENLADTLPSSDGEAPT